jgi:hypothetical protein
MSTPNGREGHGLDFGAALQPGPRPEQPLPDVTREVLAFNDESEGHEDLWCRTRQSADQVRDAEAEARDADRVAANADLGHRAVQAEYPERSAPRLRQWLIALGILALDGIACYFAAEALGGSQLETLAWAGLFLALLGAGEVTLDLCRESRHVLWRLIAVVLGVFIAMLCLLRFWFLATIGTTGLVGAGTGAGLFSLLTVCFVIIGYRALRAAETGEASRARRRARACARTAAAAHHKVRLLTSKRDRLTHAYLSRIRTRLIRICTADQLTLTEHAVRNHLIGHDHGQDAS